MSFLTDPRLFNIAIIGMFIAASIRWACAGNWPQAGYWASAAALNICLTIGAK